MATDICSIWAYEEIKESGYLGRKQGLVLSIFTQEQVPLTATEVVEKLGRTVSETSRTRIAELEKMGFLEKVDRVRCPLTNKTVNRWRWTGRTKPLECREEIVTCEHCNGVGHRVEVVYYDPDASPTQMEFMLDG